MGDDIRQLRLVYTAEGMADLLAHLDNMRLGELPEPVAMFIAHASNPANWSPVGS